MKNKEKEVELYDIERKWEFYDIEVVLQHLIENNLEKISAESVKKIACLFSELLISEVDFDKFTISNTKNGLEIFHIQIGRVDKKNMVNFFLDVYIKLAIENNEVKILFTVYDSKKIKLDLNLSLNESDHLDMRDEKIKDFFKKMFYLYKNKKAVT